MPPLWEGFGIHVGHYWRGVAVSLPMMLVHFQSARECRARKKLRYQYLDDLILEREKANIVLREEILKYQAW